MKEKNKKILVIIIAILVFLYMVWFFNFRQKMNVPGKQEQPKPNVPGKQEQPVPNIPGKQEQPVPNIPGKQEQPVPNIPGKQEEPKPNVPDNTGKKRKKLDLQNEDVNSLIEMKVFAKDTKPGELISNSFVIQGEDISLPYQPREIKSFDDTYKLENGHPPKLAHLGAMNYYHSLVANAFRLNGFLQAVQFSTLSNSLNIGKDTWKTGMIDSLIYVPRDAVQVKETPYFIQFFCNSIPGIEQGSYYNKVYKAPAGELYLELKGDTVEFYQYQTNGKFKKVCYMKFGKAEQAEKVYKYFGFFTINNLD